jgi:hypothetical protein
MNNRHERDEDRELPWDPMWAYVLGEDNDERDNHDDNTRQTEHDTSRGDSKRETEEATAGGKILKKLWKRMERDAAPTSRPIPTHSRSDDKDNWSWEIDTSQFSLMTDDNNTHKKNECGKKKWLPARNPLDTSWIGTVWKDPQQGQNRSLLSRKSS